MKWTDTTSYQRGDQDRIPRVWELRGEHVRVVVHRLHGTDPHVWHVTCHDLGIKDWVLGSAVVANAQKEALSLVVKRVKKMLQELQGR